MSDRVVSYLRTAIPVLWGSLIGLALPHIPWLPASLAEWLTGETVTTAVVALAIAGWYAAWRWAEPRLPDWLTRLVLGSALAPTYREPVLEDGRTLTEANADIAAGRHTA